MKYKTEGVINRREIEEAFWEQYGTDPVEHPKGKGFLSTKEEVLQYYELDYLLGDFVENMFYEGVWVLDDEGNVTDSL